MSRIRAICLSDLHLGSETSVLTAVDPASHGPDIERTSPLLELLVECLKEILREEPGPEKPTLVLAGDILEMALSTDNIAATVFEQFVHALSDGQELPVASPILFVPGNHDHHLWEQARERQYASYLEQVRARTPLRNPPWHVTHLFVKEAEEEGASEGRVWNVESTLLTTLIQRTDDLGEVRVQAVYPNLGLMSADEGRCTVIHHGHFTEAAYHFMTRVRGLAFPSHPAPKEIWEVEAENYAWIDFVWGTLGRSGRVGVDAGRVYYIFNSRKATRRFLAHLAHTIAERLGHAAPRRWFEQIVIRALLNWAVERMRGLERLQPDAVLSEASEQALETYLERFVHQQIRRERRKSEKNMPHEVSFVFGHTHKPFQRRQTFGGYERPVNVYNTGGWVIDSLETDPLRGGAVVLIDDEGNLASLLMYQQADSASDYAVRVEEAGAPNPLSERLRELVKPDQPPWSDFSRLAAETVRERRRNLEYVIEDAVEASRRDLGRAIRA